MKINSVPIEVYRQIGNQTPRKAETGPGPGLDTKPTGRADAVTVPGRPAAAVAPASPSLLSGVLSGEEKEMLTAFFARFGDAPDQARTYGVDARTAHPPLTGLRLDVKG
jgi:hypothetical protein